MKTVKLIMVLAAVCSRFNVEAQPVANENMKTVFAQKMPHLKLASEMIKPASIPSLKKTAVAGIDLVSQLQKLKDQCPLLLAEKPSLELAGERTSNSMVKLDWETTNGWNNRSFLIERSLGDSLHFEVVKYVWAKEIAGMRDKYHQPDDNDYNKTSYYRLKLLMRNGGFLFSNIAKVKGYAVESLRIFPNPATQKVRISVNTETKGLAAIKLYDAAGRLVVEQTNFPLAPGWNDKEIRIGPLANGFYSVKVLMPDYTERVTRLIKQ